MAKLRKPRPSTSTLPDSPEQPRTRTGSIISTSSSIQQTTSTPPIALRVGRKSAAAVVAPTVDVTGEFEFGDHSIKDLKMKSSSSTYSSDSIPRSSPSQKRSHSRNTSIASTLPSTSPTNSHTFPTSISTHSLSTSTSGSALSQLRQRLDDDQLAREKEKEKGKAKGKGHVLKKKRHDEEAGKEDEATQTADEQDGREEENEGTQTEPIFLEGDAAKKEEEEELVEVEVQVMTVVEETEEVIEEDEEEEEESTKSPSTSPDLYSNQINTSLSTPSTTSDPTPTQSTSILGNSIVFAPARLGWRVASGTVGFGLDTTKSVVRHVPIVGRLVPSSSPASSPSSSQTPTHEERQEEIESLPSPPLSTSSSQPVSFVPSTIDKKYTEEREEHGLVYRTAELGLGLGIASVLVGNALTKMAWRRLTTTKGSQNQKE